MNSSSCPFHLRLRRRAYATLAQRFGLAHIQLQCAAVFFGCGQGADGRIAANQPKRRRKHADADAGLTGLEPQQGRDTHPNAFRPGLERFFAAKAGNGEVRSKLLQRRESRWRDLGKCSRCFSHTYTLLFSGCSVKYMWHYHRDSVVASMKGGTGRPAAFSQFAMPQTTRRTAARCVMRPRHSRSFGVAPVTGAF